jgi:hypothetical protein
VCRSKAQLLLQRTRNSEEGLAPLEEANAPQVGFAAHKMDEERRRNNEESLEGRKVCIELVAKPEFLNSSSSSLLALTFSQLPESS